MQERKNRNGGERVGIRGGPVTERGREDALNGSRPGRMENRPDDRSDPMPPAGGSSR